MLCTQAILPYASKRPAVDSRSQHKSLSVYRTTQERIYRGGRETTTYHHLPPPPLPLTGGGEGTPRYVYGLCPAGEEVQIAAAAATR